ncbi:dTDP-4-dehydrorhamnose reductase [Grimontia hollisae]|uniref:dTDP-4-dehydrorhamnose reductase n=1 Tax=Grimontia hollisae TaxID=673 RepID=UPI00165D7616|nr:dTDP-4-dehydrorhamnose reductase [Grimontia hollisae]
MKVLITGSSGQVGRCLVEQLTEMKEAKFLALDRKALDITDESAVNKIVSSFLPDVIINSAAYTAVDRAEEEVELTYAINRDGPANLAKAADKVGAAILHISTDYVFAGNKHGEYIETDDTAPQSVYGKSKLAGEHAVAKACKRHIILRTAWVFSEHGSNFVKTMLHVAETRDSLGIVADQFGGPTYAGDIAKALISIARSITSNNKICFGIYHFSGLPHVSWYEFSKKIFDEAMQQGVLNKTIKVNSISTLDYPTPAKRPENSKLNNKKIQTQFGIEPSDWQSALKNLKAYTS